MAFHKAMAPPWLPPIPGHQVAGGFQRPALGDFDQAPLVGQVMRGRVQKWGFSFFGEIVVKIIIISLNDRYDMI